MVCDAYENGPKRTNRSSISQFDIIFASLGVQPLQYHFCFTWCTLPVHGKEESKQLHIFTVSATACEMRGRGYLVLSENIGPII